MNERVFTLCFCVFAFSFGGCSTAAIQTDLGIDELHFPKIIAGSKRVAIPGPAKGRLELLDNCVVLNREFDKPILLWDSQTNVKKVEGSIIITHPTFSDLTVGQVVEFDLVSGLHGTYYPWELPLEPTSNPECDPTGSVEIDEW